MRLALGSLLLLTAANVAILRSQTISSPGSASGNQAQVTFHYENPKLQPAKYSFVINEDGSGEFHSEPGSAPPEDTASYHPLAEALDRPVQLSKPVVAQIFSTARAQRFFAIPCEAAKSKVAFTGTKQLGYRGPDGQGSCTYNWSKIDSIEKLTSIFEGIAFTLEEGRRLEIEHKHDRLALDSELGVLIAEVHGGRAVEVQTITTILQGIIDDPALLERARSRAQQLLGGAAPAQAER